VNRAIHFVRESGLSEQHNTTYRGERTEWTAQYIM